MRSDLVLTPLPRSGRNRARWKLQRAYVAAESFPLLWTVVVPAGFVTDFASIPRALWWLYPPDGPWAEAAVVHDFLYSRPEVSRFLADALFWRMMRMSRVPWFRATVMYWAVRLFGRRAKRRAEG